MSLSQAEIELVVEECAPLSGRVTLQKVREVDDRTQIFRFRAPGETHYLCVSTRTEMTRLHFVDDPPEQPAKPTDVTMLLRKWLHGAELEAIEQIQGDRVVRMSFRQLYPASRREREAEEADTELGEPERRPIHLVLELADRVGNVFLLDDEERIVARQTDEAIAGRDLRSGDVWTPPPPPPNPDIGSEIRWELDELDPETFERSRRIADAYRRLEAEQRAERVRRELQSRLDDRIDKLNRRIEHVEEDLEQVEEADRYRKWAELLQSAYGQVEKGSESVRVEDFYREDMPEVDIPLDPSKTLQENIDQYYHEARRYEEAQEMVEQRLLDSIELRDRAEAALGDLESAGDEFSHEALASWRDELVDEGVLEPKTDHSTSRSRSNEERSRPYRAFEATSGKSILVGRGAESNDTLTVRVARGRDVWLHARDWPGAHVVLRMRKDEDAPTSEDLVDAATLAAHFSQGQRDTAVEIMYTRAKHVDKPKGFPPGRVSVANDSTIAVRMEEDRLERLLESEQRE